MNTLNRTALAPHLRTPLETSNWAPIVNASALLAEQVQGLEIRFSDSSAILCSSFCSGIGARKNLRHPVLHDIEEALENWQAPESWSSTPTVPYAKRRVDLCITLVGTTPCADWSMILQDSLEQSRITLHRWRFLHDNRIVQLEVSNNTPMDANELRDQLRAALSSQPIEIVVAPPRTYKMLVLDMDSTLIQIEVIDELARMHGIVDKVAAITKRSMAGELDYEASLHERVALLEGLDYAHAQSLAAQLPLTDGVPKLLSVCRQLGMVTGVISGGFTFATEQLKKRLSLDHAHANMLEVENGRLTGRVHMPVVTPERKASLFRQIAGEAQLSLDETMAAGDGANDLHMLRTAGLGIAFHAKPKVQREASAAISHGGLDQLLYVMGLSDLDLALLLD